MRHRLPTLLLCLLALAPRPGAAHEYWIAPDDHTVAPGETVALRLKVGQMLKGSELPFLSNQNAGFRMVAPEGTRDLAGLDGDIPAAAYLAEAPGLHIAVHQTLPLDLSFESFGEFREYLEYEGLGAVAGRHLARGLPESGIAEAYARSAKALIQVGPARADDSDRPVGLPYELVALGNPYAGGEALEVQLLWQGEPEAGTQLSIFRETAGGVERTLATTDAEGKATVPLGEPGLYLLNAVHIEPSDGPHHWLSDWASLTFEVAGGD